MNCLDYRRALSADPHHETMDMQVHRRECTTCTQAYVRTRGQELELRLALNVSVPTGLADRVLLAQVTSMRAYRRRGIGTALAVAAVLVLVAGGVGWWALRAQSLASLVVDHMAHEPQAFNSHPLLDTATLRKRFAERNVTLAAEPPRYVTYAANCPVGPYKSVHMVMLEHGRPTVTVFYLAGHQEHTQAEFREGRLLGRTVPMGEGTLVLVAAASEDFDTIERDWRHAIEGSVQAVADVR